MAGSHINEGNVQPAKRREWDKIARYQGTAAEIVATGLVRLEQLPGQPGQHHFKSYYRNGQPVAPVRRLDHQPDPQNWIRIERVRDTDYYFLTVGLSPEDILRSRAEKKAELALYRAENHQREKAEKEKRRLDAERELASVPACREDFLRELSGQLKSWIKGFLNYEVHKKRERFHGFMLAEEAVPDILEAFSAVQEAIERADVVFDRALHQEIILKRRHEIASADDNFQRHLALVATAGNRGDALPAG